ncbi:MAG: UvrD-helicase domain-containing protein [Ignavibacteriaceae bacterium]
MSVLTPHQNKALNIESSISLTANAGSGKTFVLSQRYLSILLNTDTPLNQVAAITFTEKAAGELYKRVSNELSRIYQSSNDSALKHRIEKIRKQLVSAKISTIHSFCIDLLKEFPVEALIDANFIPINEQKSQELINLSIENCLRGIYKNQKDQNDIKLLTRLLGSKANLIKQLEELISKRKIVLQLLEEIYSLDENEIANYFNDILRKGLNQVFEILIPSIINGIREINKKVLEYDAGNKLAIETEGTLLDLRSKKDEQKILRELKILGNKILTGKGEIRKQSYLNSKIRNEVQNEVLEVEKFFSDLNEVEFAENHKEIEKELAKYGLALIRLFQNVLNEYEIKKYESGVLDFEDILIKTRELLKVESVRESLSGKFKYLLVDEYQDTNEIQYEIFLPLLEDLRKGNLFIVGDEKQSIYRFRDAELQVFSRTKTDIRKMYGEESLLTLPDSFRMSPAICFFVNSVFKNLFDNPRTIFNEVPFSELVCARTNEFKGHIEFLIAEKERKSEAELVAEKIIQLKSEHHERISNWSDISVLVRKRASFSELQNEFIKHQIPFIIVGGTGFYQQQSISDIYNYFAFLLNDKDDGALVGVLRSPFFSISDGDILSLMLYEGETYWEKLKFAYEDEKGKWEKPYQSIEENRSLSKRADVSFVLRKILQESDFIAAISSRVNRDQELSNLNKLISVTNDFFNEEFNTLYDYVSFLNDAISKTVDEAQAGIETGSNGVNILTVHQAKGLEYPAVFLYKCNDYTSVNKVKSRSFTISKKFGLLTKVPLQENYFEYYRSAPVIGLYNLIESKKDIAELKRLLYVALTRAEDFLFISFTDEGRQIKSNSFAGLISEGLNSKFEQNSIELNGQLNFLKISDSTFFNVIEEINVAIPFTREINARNLISKEDKNDLFNPNFIFPKIDDHSTGEVISATRYSTFSGCPSKYNLLYNFKIGDIFYKSLNTHTNEINGKSEDYNRNELNSQLLDDKSSLGEYSKLKGNLIHYILSKNLEKSKIEMFVKNQIKNFTNGANTDLITKEIIDEIELFYNSEEYKFISSFNNYKNEFEIYLKEEDFYLFGIIDKLIINDDKLIIVDYKTDNIKRDEIDNREKKRIEGRIVFVKYPDNPFILTYDDVSDTNIKSDLKQMINSIRNNDYSIKQGSCKDCLFSNNNTTCKSIQ